MPATSLLDVTVGALLALHIAAGFAALAAGTAIAVLAKGDTRHRALGKIFAIGMLIVTGTAIALALVRPNVFLFTIALFSCYLVTTGWLAARTRKGAGGGGWDLLLALLGAATALGMLAAATLFWNGEEGFRAIVLAVFGVILATMSSYDLWVFRNHGVAGAARIARHLQRMMAAWIASLTAFAVVNLSFLPELAVWLGPTVLISPLTAYWSRQLYRGRLRMG